MVDGVVPMTLSFISILDVDGTLMCATVVEYVVGLNGSQAVARQFYDVSNCEHRPIIFSCALQGICDSLSCSATVMKQENLPKNTEEAHPEHSIARSKDKGTKNKTIWSQNSFSTKLFAFSSLPGNRQGCWITCAPFSFDWKAEKRKREKKNTTKFQRIQRMHEFTNDFEWIMDRTAGKKETKRTKQAATEELANRAQKLYPTQIEYGSSGWLVLWLSLSLSVPHSTC